MNKEVIEQISSIQKDLIEAIKVYENKMAKVWDRLNKLKKEMKDGTIK